MSNNLIVAEQYAKTMAGMTNKCWISDNLPMLSRNERKQVLKIYKKHFKTVDYNPLTGVCKCWVVDPYDISDLEYTPASTIDVGTGIAGGELKESTVQGLKMSDKQIVIVTNSKEPA